MKLTIRHFFDAAHQLPDTEHLITKGCANLHGHTYAVKIEFDGDSKDLKGGMVVDFKGIKNIVDILDHRFINDVFMERNFPYIASSEYISRFIYEEILMKYPYLQNLVVSICEGYKGEERGSWTTYDGK